MLVSVLISTLTCLALILIILIKPSIKIGGKEFDIYWIAPILGAILLLAFKAVNWVDIKEGFFNNSASNPLKVLVLFFSMSFISVYLDETGFIEYLASITVKKAGTSQKKLFLIFYVTVSILTIFTSNDIVILTFTPFICKFCKYAEVDAVPYCVAEFVGANTWSMLLVIGNPTNIFLATAVGIDFAEYFSVMLIPTVLGGLSGFGVLYLTFRKKLQKPMTCVCESQSLKEKPLAIIGLIHLVLCTVTLAVSGYINIEMWIVSLAFALSLAFCVAVYRIIVKEKPTILYKTVKRVPILLAPTVIGMFVVAISLVKCGATASIANFLGSDLVILKYGVLSTAFSNFMNNIPMSVLFSSIISSANAGIMQKAVYSSIIGSNLGALPTPVGALAGIMFTSVLKRHGQKFGFKDFIKYGLIVAVVSLAFALLGLFLRFLW